MSITNKLKNKINKFINKLAEENKKSFGNENLDCCNLNDNKKNNK